MTCSNRDANRRNQPGSATIHTVAVIGAGMAGRDFALRCAAAGHNVILEDVMPAKLRHAEQDFATLPQQGTVGSWRLALTVEDAVREADLAIDFVPDELESKLEIFSMIDRMAPPKTILLTPTEALSITDLASCTYRPDRCVALRGAFTENSGRAARLIAPEEIDAGVLAATEAFLLSLHLDAVPETDADAPMLVRNYL